jgi:hypothetical protein
MSRLITPVFKLTLPHARYVPIVILALIFNFTNAIGFTYAYVNTFYPSTYTNLLPETETRNNVGQTKSSVVVGALATSVVNYSPEPFKKASEGYSDNG